MMLMLVWRVHMQLYYEQESAHDSDLNNLLYNSAWIVLVDL